MWKSSWGLLGPLVIAVVAEAVTWSNQVFMQKTAFIDTACTSQTVYDFGKTSSSLICGLECDKTTGCSSFFFNTLTGTCNGLATIFTDVCGTAAQGNKYYVKGMIYYYYCFRYRTVTKQDQDECFNIFVKYCEAGFFEI